MGTTIMIDIYKDGKLVHENTVCIAYLREKECGGSEYMVRENGYESLSTPPPPAEFNRYLDILRDSDLLNEFSPVPDDFTPDNMYYIINNDVSYGLNCTLLSAYRLLWEDPRGVRNVIKLYDEWGVKADSALALAKSFMEDGQILNFPQTGHSFGAATTGCYNVKKYLKLAREGGLIIHSNFKYSPIRVTPKKCKYKTLCKSLLDQFNVEYRIDYYY